jgi:hypothetical protein
MRTGILLTVLMLVPCLGGAREQIRATQPSRHGRIDAEREENHGCVQQAENPRPQNRSA